MVINKECVVIFPVYRSISECEKECFEQAVRMTNGFKKIIIAPKSYQLDQSFGSVLSSLEYSTFRRSFL